MEFLLTVPALAVDRGIMEPELSGTISEEHVPNTDNYCVNCGEDLQLGRRFVASFRVRS